MKKIIELKDLSIDFKSPIIKKISFEVNQGEIVGIVGESGSGKSLTALSILKLLPKNAKTNGKIIFEDQDLLSLSENEMQKIRGNRIGMILQDPMTALNPILSIGEQISEGICFHQKKSRQEAWEMGSELLESLGIDKAAQRMSHYPHQFSGGQRQRIVIAIALACQPELLIADEPTTALDVTVQKQILQLIKEQQARSKMGIIFISHDLGVIAHLCDRIIVMKDGEIIEQGTVQEVLRESKSAYTKTLIEAKKQPNQESDKKEFSQIPFIEVRDLSKRFTMQSHEIQALDNLSFSIYPGEVLGLAGESGSGKSTLGRALLRLIQSEQGRVEFDGLNIMQISPKEMKVQRKHLQIVFQSPYSSLNPSMTVRDILCEPLIIHGLQRCQRENYIEKLMDDVLLPKRLLSVYPKELSGGQRQRVGIARALAVEPRFLVCDELLSALDATTQMEIIKLLQSLKQKRNLTLLFISHDLCLMRSFTDRMAIMQQGKIVEMGATADLFRSPQHPYTKLLLSSMLSIPMGYHDVISP